MASIAHFVLSCLLATHFLFRVGAKARVIGLLSISYFLLVSPFPSFVTGSSSFKVRGIRPGSFDEGYFCHCSRRLWRI